MREGNVAKGESVKQEMTVQGHLTKQSPLNPNQWNLVLSCGHEIWVTRKRRPTAMKAICQTCTKEAQRG